jgi:hypothetical protein
VIVVDTNTIGTRVVDKSKTRTLIGTTGESGRVMSVPSPISLSAKIAGSPEVL